MVLAPDLFRKYVVIFLVLEHVDSRKNEFLAHLYQA